jgi:hypothetical protein
LRDVDTILKWAATVILIIGTAVNSAGYYPQGPIILLIGGLVWLTVALRWREPALIVTNGIMSLTGVIGLVYAAIK